MGIHKTPVDLYAKSVFKKNLLSSKSVLGRKRKAKVPVWRIATWNIHGGLTAPVKSIMFSRKSCFRRSRCLGESGRPRSFA